MKRNILGILGIVIAISASAFTSTNKTVRHNTDLKWFTISGNIAPTASVPPANATYLTGEDGPTPPDEGCSGSTKQCVSGFNASQVTPSNTLNGTQMPVDHSSLRN